MNDVLTFSFFKVNRNLLAYRLRFFLLAFIAPFYFTTAFAQSTGNECDFDNIPPTVELFPPDTIELYCFDFGFSDQTNGGDWWLFSDNCASEDNIEITVNSFEFSDDGFGCNNFTERYEIIAEDLNGNLTRDTLTVVAIDDEHPHILTLGIQTGGFEISFDGDIDLLQQNDVEVEADEIVDVTEDDIVLDLADDCGSEVGSELLSISEDENFTTMTYDLFDDCGNSMQFDIIIEFPAVFGCTDSTACNFDPQANVPGFCDTPGSISLENFPLDEQINCEVYGDYTPQTPDFSPAGIYADFWEISFASSSDQTGGSSCPGAQLVTESYTLTNLFCNTRTYERQIEVIDLTDPEVTGEDSVSVLSLDEITVEAVDNCSENLFFSSFDVEIGLNLYERTSLVHDGCINIFYNSASFDQIVTLLVQGCMDPAACNYDPFATIEMDGDCDYSSSISLDGIPQDETISCEAFANYQMTAPELGAIGPCSDWEVIIESSFEEDQNCPNAGVVSEIFTLNSDCCNSRVFTRELIVIDTEGPEINGDVSVLVPDLDDVYITASEACSQEEVAISYTDTEESPNIYTRLYTVSDECGNESTFEQEVVIEVLGCLDPTACNYNPDATVESQELCVYGGCLNQDACNYDANAACEDNGTCIYADEITATIVGTAGSETPVSNGFTVSLYAVPQAIGPIDALQESVLTEEGVSFEGFDIGDYLIRTVPDAQEDPQLSQFVSTYHDGTYYWEESLALTIGECESEIPMSIEGIEFEESAGDAQLSGRVLDAGMASDPDFSGNDGLSGVPVILLDLAQALPGTELPLPVGFSLTNDLGEFSFNNVESGDYSIIVDIPGLPMLQNYSEFIENDEALIDLDFFVVVDAGIYTSQILSISEGESLSLLSVFPNPFKDEFKLVVPEINETLEWRIYDLTGNLLYNGKCRYEGNCTIRLDDLSSGMYILVGINGKAERTVKLIKH